MADLTPHLIAVVIATIAALPGLLALIAQRKKSSVDVASVLTASVLSTLTRKDQDIADTEKELSAARDEARGLNRRLDEEIQKRLRLQAHLKVVEDNAAALSRELAACREECAALRAELDTKEGGHEDA